MTQNTIDLREYTNNHIKRGANLHTGIVEFAGINTIEIMLKARVLSLNSRISITHYDNCLCG